MSKAHKGSPNADRGLSPMQAVFAREYLVDFNGKAAAIRAGYSPRSAHVQASTILAYPAVQAEIKRIQQVVESKTTISMAEVVDEMRKLALFSVRDLLVIPADGGDPYVDLSRATPEQLDAINEITVVHKKGGGRDVKFKAADKLGALSTLLKHLGGLPDTQIHVGPDGKALAAPPLVVNNVITKK